MEIQFQPLQTIEKNKKAQCLVHKILIPENKVTKLYGKKQKTVKHKKTKQKKTRYNYRVKITDWSDACHAGHQYLTKPFGCLPSHRRLWSH